ncbi:MAG: ATP-binding protein [Terriglobia bacterium]
MIGDGGSDLIAIVDTKGRRLYNSPSYERLLGYSQDDLKNTFGMDQIHPDDRAQVLAAAEQARQTGKGSRLEYRILHRDGSWRILESTASAVRNHRGEIHKLVIINRDITAQREQAREILRQKEEQLRQAHKMEAIGRLSGGVAHDFNNLLSIIIGYAEDLESSLHSSDHLRKHAEEVRKAGERAASLTRQLLAFSRQKVAQPQVLDVNVLVADLSRMLRRMVGSDIEFALHLDPLVGRVKADRGQIEQVLMNLVVNARDAMPDGGSITVSSRDIQLRDKDTAGIPGSTPGQYVELAVTDSGTGMSKETLAHIFDPFFTTKAEGKGTGLGLSTVFGIAKQSDGDVAIDSEPGRGTTIRVYLPRVAEPAQQVQAPTTDGELPRGSETILLVDDEELVRGFEREVLTSSGYTVLEAHGPRHALEIARAHPGIIDLLLTDVLMPELSGPELSESLCRERPDMQTLYTSGYTPDAIAQHGILEPDAFISKPLDRSRLAHKVREVLDSAG